MDNDKLEEVRERLLATVEKRFKTKREGAEFLVEECNFSFTAGTLVEKLNGKATMRLKEFMRMADALNINYRWLFTGTRQGWESVPADSVRLLNQQDEIIAEFKVPKDWPLNLRAYPGLRGHLPFSRVERGEKG